MKKLFYVLPVFAVPVMLLTMSYHSGSPGGRTGSPGDNGNTCTTCHSGTATAAFSWITTNVPQTGYVGGQTYTITATGTHPGVVRFGFELTVEDSQGNKVGTLQLTDPVRTKLINGGDAVTHTSDGTTPAGNSNSWSMNWVAPTGVEGNIGIYAAFNAANGNGNTSGDVIYKSSIFISPYTPLPALVSIDPASATQGDQVTALITATDTEFTLSTPLVSLSFPGMPGDVIQASSVNVISDTQLEAVFIIPGNASPGLWDLHVDELVLPGSFTINLLIGIGDNLTANVKVFPNPASQRFFVEHANDADLAIFSTSGKMVLTRKIQSEKQTIDVSGLSRGIYVVRISMNGENRTEKLLVN